MLNNNPEKWIYVKIKAICNKKKKIKSEIKSDKKIELRDSPESLLPRIV